MINPSQIYKELYVKRMGGTLPKKQFHALVMEYNRMLVDRLLEGKPVSLSRKLGTLRIVKKKHTFKKPKVNWPASKQYKKQLEAEGTPLYDDKTGKGKKWIIYYLPEFRYMFLWDKPRPTIRNSHVFKFHPTRASNNGRTPAPVDRLARLINSDDLAYLKFKTL